MSHSINSKFFISRSKFFYSQASTSLDNVELGIMATPFPSAVALAEILVLCCLPSVLDNTRSDRVSDWRLEPLTFMNSVKAAQENRFS